MIISVKNDSKSNENQANINENHREIVYIIVENENENNQNNQNNNDNNDNMARTNITTLRNHFIIHHNTNDPTTKQKNAQIRITNNEKSAKTQF